MGLDDFLSTGLVLGLGFSSSTAETQKSAEINQKPNKQGFKFDHQLETMTTTVSINLEPSLTLSLPCESSYEYDDHHHHQQQVGNNKKLQDLAIAKVQSIDLYGQDRGGASSFSNVSVKREREFGSEDGETTTDQRVSNSKVSDEEEDDDGSNGRKKLRLSKAQSALLEECFKEHNTLNPKQKQELAKELKLRPRQVEVWFQNRRARTKLKQTEVDCEFLKKCCQALTDENRRLQKEIQELKSVKLAQPLYMHMPATTLTMCPSCERIGGSVGVGHDNTSKNSLITMAPKTHFYNRFLNPSAAC